MTFDEFPIHMRYIVLDELRKMLDDDDAYGFEECEVIGAAIAKLEKES